MVKSPSHDVVGGISVFGGPDHSPSASSRVVFGQDRSSGLKAIISIDSTALGPALGGTRFYPYANEGEALRDVLRLSRGMTFKAAAAGLDLGGGKAVILGDPIRLKTPALLEAYGRLVDSLGGDYITAGDVGTSAADMDVVGRTTRHVVSRTAAAGGSGDSAHLTALGVFQAMRAAAQRQWGAASLAGRVVGVEGLGKVGLQLVGLLLADGARVVANDVAPDACRRARAQFERIEIVESVTDAPDLDVYAPCALGGTLTTQVVPRLSERIVCGAANNQLASADVEPLLAAHSVSWVPDYVANSGGLIQVAGEIAQRDHEVVVAQVDGIFHTVASILAEADESGITASSVADRRALARLTAAEFEVQA